MSLKPIANHTIPEQTIEIAKAAFPKGNVYIQIRDELGVIFDDTQFESLFSHTGQPALTPWRLALVTVMQFAENLSDRQAADAVRSRIDWKYALGLEMNDRGFNFSVLSEFRTRLIEGGQEALLLDSMLNVLKDKELVVGRGKQRTDSSHILTSARELNRLELVGETLHHALNVLADVVPEWVQQTVPEEWYKRYGLRFENSRLPNDESDRQHLAVTIGEDGRLLLESLCSEDELQVLWQATAIETLRQVWVQQYLVNDDVIVWRSRRDHGMPPAAITLLSPYDAEARYGQKRNKRWVGYKVHLTESCDDERPHIITNVETTTADIPDNHLVEPIHESLKSKSLLPADTGSHECGHIWRVVSR